MDDEEWPEKIVLRRDDTRRRRPNSGADGSPNPDDDRDTDTLLFQDSLTKKASFELPVEVSSEGLVLLKDAEVSMLCSMPPSRVDGKWSGTIEGQSSISPDNRVEKSSSGSITLDYRTNSWSKLSFGMIRGTKAFHPLVSLGGTIMKDGSAMSIQLYQNPAFLHPTLLGHSMYSLSFQHKAKKSNWKFQSKVSRTQELSASISNRKMEGGFDWSLRQPEQLHLHLSVAPKLSEDRQARLYCRWRKGLWHVGGSLVQSLNSQVATMEIGLRIFSFRGLEWIFSWNRGDASIRIPLVLSRSLDTASTLPQMLYFSMLSFFFQEAIAEIWGWKKPESSSEDEDKELKAVADYHLEAKKAKADAELQRQLMSRQAKRKTREEKEKGGLVIHEAMYEKDGGERWDATVQLQFWVSAQSSLALPPKSKKELLGFYDLDTSVPESHTSSHNTPGNATSWWRTVWNDLWVDNNSDTQDEPRSFNKNDGKSKGKGAPATLTVVYSFKGEEYTISVTDQEALQLPNPMAVKKRKGP